MYDRHSAAHSLVIHQKTSPLFDILKPFGSEVGARDLLLTKSAPTWNADKEQRASDVNTVQRRRQRKLTGRE